MKQREESIKRYQEWEIEQDKLREATKINMDRLAVEKQMDMEDRGRRVLQDIKNEEKKVEEDRLYEELERLEVKEKEISREDPVTPHFGGEEVREE